MFMQKLLRPKNIYNSKFNYLLKKYSKQSAAASRVEYNEKILFSPHREKKPKIDSILLNLALNNMKEEMFSFPEVLNIQRYKDFFNWLYPIENYVSHCANANEKLNKKEILENLKELNVFGACMEEDYGLNLSETESVYLIETVSTIPWLGTYLVKNNILPVKLISKYGTAIQKQLYYPKIISGEVVPTICIHEGGHGTNINNITSQAVQIEGDAWMLNGEKTFVINGTDSNLFLVFARSISNTSSLLKPDSFSLFLVEKDPKSVTCNKIHETIGRHEIPICSINFKDTIIPAENIIGKPGTALHTLLNVFKPGNQNLAAQAIGILRNFVNQLIPDILKFKHFDRDLHQFDVVKNTLGEILFTLYTMESMVYFTSGLIDLYEKADIEIENVITEKYCANKCLSCIQAGMQLLGAHSYLNNTSYIQAYHDALALTTLDMNNLDANTYAASAFLKNLGKHLHEHVYKQRNETFFPLYDTINKLFDKSRADINIVSNFHPSLKNGVEYFQGAVNEFRRSIDGILIQQGSEVMQHYTLLEKITDMLTEIYAGFTNLSRSSRSYSTGVRNSGFEKDLTICMGYTTFENIGFILQHLNNQNFNIAKSHHINISDEVYTKQRYCMEHPLTRTLF